MRAKVFFNLSQANPSSTEKVTKCKLSKKSLTMAKSTEPDTAQATVISLPSHQPMDKSTSWPWSNLSANSSAIPQKAMASPGTPSTTTFYSQDKPIKKSASGTSKKINSKIQNIHQSLKLSITMPLLRMLLGIDSIKISLPVVLMTGFWWFGIRGTSQMDKREKRNHCLRLSLIQMKSILSISLLSTNFYSWVDQQIKQPQFGTCET